MMDSVTVITLTRGRIEMLKRALHSVSSQDYPGQIKHLIIIDDCPITKTFFETSTGIEENFEWHLISREKTDKSGPAHVAKLRNYAVHAAATEWISFLDDDNEFESNHISSLVSCAKQKECKAVHSQMKIFWPDGTLYLDQRMPWCRDIEESKRYYVELCDKGVFQPGSNIVRDRADPLGYPDPARTVDAGEWLLARTLLLEYPFCTEYNNIDWKNVTTEDDKLLQTLIENRIPITSTEQPTLRYYLGGYSNNFESQGFGIPGK